MISNWQEKESDGSPMRLHVSVPDGAGPFAALIVMQHQGGVDQFVQDMTRRLAGAGYLAAAPDLYCRVRTSSLLRLGSYCWTRSTIGMMTGGCASSMPSSSMTGPRYVRNSSNASWLSQTSKT